MSKFRVSSFAVSLDGFGAGPRQDWSIPWASAGKPSWSGFSLAGLVGTGPALSHPVFVLTHHARAPLRMAGGTEFRFVTGGIHRALDLARDAAGDKDVRLGGGVATIRQYVEARLLDELHLAVRPILLGGGEALFVGIDLPRLGYEALQSIAGERATRVVLRRR